MSSIYFTYLMGWSSHDKWYYGRRTAKGCNPSDLWSIYFTSSKHVKKFRELHGEPDIIQIRKTFTDKHKCELFEVRVLRRVLLSAHRDKWLNKTIGDGLNGYGYRFLSEESRQKMRDAKLGKTQDREVVARRIAKMVETRRSRDGWKVSEETKMLISRRTSEAMKGRVFTDEHKQNLSKALKGRKRKPLSERTQKEAP